MGRTARAVRPTQRSNHFMLSYRLLTVTRRLALLLVLLAAACDGPQVIPPPGNAIALRVERIGGGPRPAGDIDIPQFELYGDGTLIAADGVEGALPVFRKYHLTSSTFTRIYDRARAAGLATPHNDDTQVPDAPVLVITFGQDTTQSVTRIVAPEPDAEPVRAVQVNPNDLTDKDFTAPPEPYAPDRIAIVASPRQPTSGVAPVWPLQPLREGTRVNGGECVLYTGSTVAQAIALARSSAPGAAWTRDGDTYGVFFRPLLPDEPNCESLNRR